jgi:hypothetical protein
VHKVMSRRKHEASHNKAASGRRTPKG